MSQMRASPRHTTIMVKKKQQWQEQAQSTARTVYADDSFFQPEQNNRYRTRLTGNKFLETLPLINSGDAVSGKDEGVQAMFQDDLRQSSIGDSAAPTTFEDYRHNLQTGSMALVTDDKQTTNRMNESKLSVRVRQNFTDRTSKLSAIQSMKSLNKHSSKGILPTLNRSPSPTLLDPIDPEKEQRLKNKLDYSSFQGQDIPGKKSLVDGIANRHVKLQKQFMKDLEASVTLKDGWRKVLLPSLDLRKQNSVDQSPTASQAGGDLAIVRPDHIMNRLDERSKKRVTYESNRIKSLVNETNVAGRQSVRNLLQIYTPNVASSRKELPNVSSQSTQNRRVPFMSPTAAHSYAETPHTADNYHIMIETSSSRRKTSHMNSPHGDPLSLPQHQASLRQSLQENAMRNEPVRNSEAYALFRSQPKPIKRVILHSQMNSSEFDLTPHYADPMENSAFTESQLLRAVQSTGKQLNRSVSPVNYDNWLGYAPRTIRLFNNKARSGAQGHKQSNLTRINGKLMNKDNVFGSIATSQNFRSGRNQGRFRVAPLATGGGYPSQLATPDIGTNPLNMRHSLHSVHTRLQQSQNRTSIASMNNSRSSQMSVGRTSDPGSIGEQLGSSASKKLMQINLQVGNAKDWAPTEMLSRSQVYAQKPASIDSSSLSIEKGSEAVQQIQVYASLQQSLDPEGVVKLGPFIKVSNMVLDTKSMSSTDESHSVNALQFMRQISEWPEQTSHSILQENLTNTVLLDYNNVPKTVCGNTVDQKGANQIIVPDFPVHTPVANDLESEYYMANQGTQVIQEENSEDINPLNDEEWTAEVNKILEKQHARHQNPELKESRDAEGKASLTIDRQSKYNTVHQRDATLNNTNFDQASNSQHDQSKRKLCSPSNKPVRLKLNETDPQQQKLHQTHYLANPHPQNVNNAGSILTQEDLGVPPPMSSSSTMHLQTVSNLKRQTGGMLSQRGPPVDEQSSHLRSEYRQKSNCDIGNVLASKTQTVMLKNDLGKNVTETDFKLTKLQALPVFKIGEHVKEYNRSALVIKGKVPHETEKGPKDTFQLQARDIHCVGDKQAELDTASLQDSSVNFGAGIPSGKAKHPALMEAIQRSKSFKIKGPVRGGGPNKRRLLAAIPSIIEEQEINNLPLPLLPHQIYIPLLPSTFNQDDASLKEQGTLAMTVKSSVFQLHSVGVSERDTENQKPSRLAVNSLLHASEGSLHQSEVKRHENSEVRIASLEEFTSRTPKLMNPTNANTVIVPTPTLTPTKDLIKVAHRASPMKEQDLRASPTMTNNSSSMLQYVPTMKEIAPINLEFRIEDNNAAAAAKAARRGQQSPRRPNLKNESSLKKVSLLKNSSNTSFQKERNKKVTFTKSNIMPQPEAAIAKLNSNSVELDVMMHIQQMVKKNRYDYPKALELERKGLNRDLEIKKGSGSYLELHVKKADMATLLAEKQTSEISKVETQLDKLPTEGDQRETSTMQDNYGKKHKQNSQLALPTIQMDSPRVSNFRRTQEKFTQKLQAKMTLLKPLRSRQHTGKKSYSPTFNDSNFKFAHNEASISTFKDPESPILNMGNQVGMHVAKQNQEQVIKSPVNSTHISHATKNNNIQLQLQGDARFQGNGSDHQISREDISQAIRQLMQTMAQQHKVCHNINIEASKSKIGTNFSTQQGEQYAIDYLNLKNQTHSSAQGSSPGVSQLNFLAARLQDSNTKNDVHVTSANMLIIGSPEELEKEATAILPGLQTPSEGPEYRLATSSPKTCSTPSSNEQVQKLIQLTDQLNITPAPFGLSSRGSNERVDS